MRLFLEKHSHTFGPEAVERLSKALNDAWERVETSGAINGQDRAARDALPRCIVDAAKQGERDHHRLVKKALLRFNL